MLIVTPVPFISFSTVALIFSPVLAASSSFAPNKPTAISSPPQRQTMSKALTLLLIISETFFKTASPSLCPRVSFISLNLSKSQKSKLKLLYPSFRSFSSFSFSLSGFLRDEMTFSISSSKYSLL